MEYRIISPFGCIDISLHSTTEAVSGTITCENHYYKMLRQGSNLHRIMSRMKKFATMLAGLTSAQP